MSKLCPKCRYIGKGNFQSFYSLLTANIYAGAVLIAIGVSSIARNPITTLEGTLERIVGFPFIIWGVYNILNYFSEGKTCPKCGNKKMLPLDDPQALELIKKYDLKPGENPMPGTFPETNPNPE